ncbi:serine hydrolase domain-containing protein [Streptomyces sp. NPDC058045]|uniref:serine hydrolase domain-containing protein n=1 Tax=Streptomyces sp. NPDC058045 TaxID=3346311 RepID=UPI0036E56679
MTPAAPHPVGAAALERAVAAVDAPDVVFAVSEDGHRTIRTGGTHPAPPTARELLRYETGSASKTLTALLLARLEDQGRVDRRDTAAALLGTRPPAHRAPVTLAHLMTHTSGLPPLPADFYPGALPRWSSDPYAHYGPERVVRAFLRSRPHHRPGSRWRYSNFAVATLGQALATAAGTGWSPLLTREVLAPLGLRDTALHPGPPGTDAVGHRADGSTTTPPLRAAGFDPAGAVRAAPHDLLTLLEAHLRPGTRQLAAALTTVQQPLLRRGPGRRETHTLGWFRHDTEHGPVCFHAGATCGQQAFLGFRPDTGRALVALTTRRHRLRDPFVATAYQLLTFD